MKKVVMVLCVCLLTACGLTEVGTATAVHAQQQAEQAKQAKQVKETAERLQGELEAVAKANEQRLKQMDTAKED